MGYQFNSENFEKIIYESIKKDKKQMDFLKENCCKFFYQEGTQQEKLYFFSQFIYKWYLDIRKSIRINSTDITVTNETKSIFYDLLDEIFELVSFVNLAEEIIEEIKKEVIQNE